MTACQNYKYNGFFDCSNYIYKSESLRGFYRGGSLIFVQSFTCATILFLYDKIANDFRNLHSVIN